MEIGNRPVDITDDLGESSLYITAWINDKPIECLIDSGASISVINFKEYQSRKSALLKPLSRCRRPICIANGQTVEAPGIAHLPLGIDDTQFEVPLVIADIAVPVILGMDFIRKQKGIIDSNNNEVILNGVHYKCHDYEMKSHIFRVTVAEDIEIPANSEMIIPGKIDGMHSQTAVIECNGRLPEEYGVLVARGLVSRTSWCKSGVSVSVAVSLAVGLISRTSWCKSGMSVSIAASLVVGPASRTSWCMSGVSVVIAVIWCSSPCRTKGSHRRRYLLVKSVLSGVVGHHLRLSVTEEKTQWREEEVLAVLGIGNSVYRYLGNEH